MFYYILCETIQPIIKIQVKEGRRKGFAITKLSKDYNNMYIYYLHKSKKKYNTGRKNYKNKGTYITVKQLLEFSCLHEKSMLNRGDE